MNKKLIAAVLCCAFVLPASAEVLGILHPNAAISSTTITRAEARAYYLMKVRRFADGQRVVLFQMPRSTYVHKAFVRDVLNLSPEQYAREWDKLVNAGLSSYIQSVPTSQDMLLSVKQTPNALGYLDENNLILHNGKKDVKILRIID